MVQATPTVPKGSNLRILNEVSEQEALGLKFTPEFSVGIILYGLRVNPKNDKLQMLLIDEYQDYTETDYTKFPSATKNFEDIDALATARRELFGETGHTAEKTFYVKGWRTTSTRKHETCHYKLFYWVHDLHKVGEPTEKCIKRVFWEDLDKIMAEPEKYIKAFDQRMALKALKELVKITDYELGSRIANLPVADWWEKYHKD